MADIFAGYNESLVGPASHAEPVGDMGSPPVSYEFSNVSRAIWVGGTGDLAVTMADGTNRTFTNIPDGTLLWIRVTHVLAATSASDILALW